MTHKAHIVSALAASAFSAALLLAPTAAHADGCQGTACYNLVKTPPTYATVAERKLVRKTQTRRRVVPARYATVTEKVLIQPARQIPHHVEGQYYSISDKVLIAPGGPRWEVTTDIYGRTSGCWIYDEPQYGFRQRLVESAPARIEYETIPAVYTQRERRVLVRPTRVVNETIRAGYKTRYRKVLVSPGSEHWQRAGY
ncbi:MAG TPA: hypothetical protein VGN82_19005 [Bosea sp. (in: a-proteobacteria)]|jgi:hypothetical protein|uniref:hypothetical protein n=1 Tax=Bosea sp. (in: a-proteobacteria) TaxID=1871050 RepID=UPI002E1337C9|nr:hypothetical protein [Bosea sp. (in: a-proteobacteria)]